MKRLRLSLLKGSIVYLLLAAFVTVAQLPILTGVLATSNPNVATRLILLDSIVKRGTTSIDEYHELTVDKAFHDEHYYSDKAPGIAFLGIPAYVFSRSITGLSGNTVELFPASESDQSFIKYAACFRFIIFTSVGVFVVLSTLAFFMIAKHITQSFRPSLLAALMLSLATPLFGWSTYFVGHAPAAACLFVAFSTSYFIRNDQTNMASLRMRAIVVGFILALAISIEYTAAPAAALIGFYAIYRVSGFPLRDMTKMVSIALLSFLISLLPLLIYQTVTFGGPFSVGYSNVVGFEGMEQGFLGITYPDITVLSKLLFSKYRGIFILSPVLIFVPISVIMMWKQRLLIPEMTLSLLIITYYFGLNASYFYWDGGASTGPRHITPALPFCAFLMIYSWWKVEGKARLVLYSLFLLSVIFNVASASTTMTAFENYKFPLWDPILTSFFKGSTSWEIYTLSGYKYGLSQSVVFGVWILILLAILFCMWVVEKRAVRNIDLLP